MLKDIRKKSEFCDLSQSVCDLSQSVCTAKIPNDICANSQACPREELCNLSKRVCELTQNACIPGIRNQEGIPRLPGMPCVNNAECLGYQTCDISNIKSQSESGICRTYKFFEKVEGGPRRTEEYINWGTTTPEGIDFVTRHDKFFIDSEERERNYLKEKEREKNPTLRDKAIGLIRRAGRGILDIIFPNRDSYIPDLPDEVYR